MTQYGGSRGPYTAQCTSSPPLLEKKTIVCMNVFISCSQCCCCSSVQSENSSIYIPAPFLPHTYTDSQTNSPLLHPFPLGPWDGQWIQGKWGNTYTPTHTRRKNSGSVAPFRPLFCSVHQSCQSQGISHCPPPHLHNHLQPTRPRPTF